MLRRLMLRAAPAALLLSVRPAAAQSGGVSLFRIIGPRDEVTIGVTEAELDRLGPGPAVGRLARALVAEGQITVWQYAVVRAPGGSMRFAAIRRIAVLRNDALRIEPYGAALPVAPPPPE